MIEIEKLLVTPEEAAQAVGSSRSQIYLEMAAGRLKSVKVGRNRRISVDALREYVERIVAEQELREPVRAAVVKDGRHLPAALNPPRRVGAFEGVEVVGVGCDDLRTHDANGATAAIEQQAS